jgi:hypothetical protein
MVDHSNFCRDMPCGHRDTSTIELLDQGAFNSQPLNKLLPGNSRLCNIVVSHLHPSSVVLETI